MGVTKEQLANYVAELGLEKEQTEQLITTLMGNEKAATQFVGQRLRHDDYTKKTQEVATHKERLEQAATQEVAKYAQELQKADDRIQAIMTDLENEKISAATANARLAKVKEVYKLSDQDIPAVDGVPKPAGTGKDPNDRGGGIDIDAKLGSFRKELMAELRRDMMALPRITAVQSDIAADHQELTGKRMSRSEMNDLIADAEKRQIRLEDAWNEKYDIPKLRKEKEHKELEKTFRDKWDAEQKQRNSEDALAGVRRVDPNQARTHSPVLGRKFNEHQDPAKPAPPTSPQPQPVAAQQPKLSGAERAAVRFNERRANGIPLGAPDPPRGS